jgi:hypothetical protein
VDVAAADGLLLHHAGGQHWKRPGLNNVATCFDALGRSSEALYYYEMGLSMAPRLYKSDHAYLATSLNNIGA